MTEASNEQSEPARQAMPVDWNDLVADESGLEQEKARGSAVEVPFDPTKIDIVTRPMAISVLEDFFVVAMLDLGPNFPRQANAWDAKWESRLIESILLRIPLPSLYFSENTNGDLTVVDGLKRLCAVFHFIAHSRLNKVIGTDMSPLRLAGLQYLKELEGKSFDELDRKYKRRIHDTEISANIIRANTPAEVKFNVFARLNQGGLALRDL